MLILQNSLNVRLLFYKGETISTGIEREVKEETGYTVEAINSSYNINEIIRNDSVNKIIYFNCSLELVFYCVIFQFSTT